MPTVVHSHHGKGAVGFVVGRDDPEAACRRLSEENQKLKEKTNEEEERLRRMSTKVNK
jgi:hypothetical protein